MPTLQGLLRSEFGGLTQLLVHKRHLRVLQIIVGLQVSYPVGLSFSNFIYRVRLLFSEKVLL